MERFYYIFGENPLANQIEFSSSSNSTSSSSSCEIGEEQGQFANDRIPDYIRRAMRKRNKNFERHFRMPKTKAKWLMAKYRKAWLSKGKKPTVKIEIAVLSTLWWLANKSTYRATAERFDITEGMNHKIVLKFCKILHGDRAKFIKWPRREDFLAITYGFPRFPGVIGAVDGTHIEIPKPKNDDSYNNRKLSTSIQAQLVCDGRKQFIDVFCGYPGSCHDARVWKESPLYEYLSRPGQVPINYHVIGDSAYPLDTFLMRPYRDNGNLTAIQRNFNLVHSSARMIVENAIGLLKGKFRRLKNLEIYKIQNAKFYIIAAACLHNFILRDEIEIVDLDDIDVANSSSSGTDSDSEDSSDSDGRFPEVRLVENNEDIAQEEILNISAIRKRDRIAAELAIR